MEYKFTLPMEIVNKILIMRPTHPNAELIQFCDEEYYYFYGDVERSNDNDWNYIENAVSFKYFALNEFMHSRAQERKFKPIDAKTYDSDTDSDTDSETYSE